MSISRRIKKYIDPTIKVGDKIKIIDGSGLTVESGKKVYIVYPYFEITKSNLNLQAIDGEVVETNINNYVSEGAVETCYLQDIIIKLGEGTFRTCSEFVKKV